MASLPSKWLQRTGWLYSMRSANRRVVTASQPSLSASSRAALTMTWRRWVAQRLLQARPRLDPPTQVSRVACHFDGTTLR